MRIFNITTLVIILFLSGLNTVAAQEEIKEERVGLKVKPTVGFHGRIQYDFEFLNMKADSAGGEDYTLKGQEFRRVYLSASGVIYKNIKYKAQFEFAGGEIGYRDVYIKFTKLPGIGGDFTFGSFAEPTGLDGATSSKYIPFMERAMLTNTQNFRWNSGLMYENFGMFDGKLGLQLSYAFNGKHGEGFKDKKIDQGAHLVARLTSPIYKEGKNLVHIGVNYENRKRSEAAADYTLKFRPENHLGSKVAIPVVGLEDQSDIGFEAAAVFGPLSIQAEYEIATYNTSEKSHNVNGYYAAVTYFVTGDSRGYKNGAFSRVKPFENFCIKDKEYGAVELVARYSVMDFSEVVGGEFNNKVSNITAGVNWYLNSHTRLMYNYVLANFNKDGDNNPLTANMFRVQVDF